MPQAIVAESRAFLQWVADDHMTLLGYRQHDLVEDKGQAALQLVPSSGLGLLRETAEEKLSASFSALPPQAGPRAGAAAGARGDQGQHALYCASRRIYRLHRVKRSQPGRGDRRTPLHRPVHVNRVQRPRVETPLLRGRWSRSPAGPACRRADTWRRPWTTSWRLTARRPVPDVGRGPVQHGARHPRTGRRHGQLRLFLWRDPFDRFVSCLIYVPREAYATDLRLKFQRILMTAFDGTSAEFDVLLSEAVLARIHFRVRTKPGQVPDFERKDIERKLAAAARRWDDELRDALVEAQGEGAGLALFKQWCDIPPGLPRPGRRARAVPDVLKLAGAAGKAPLALALYQTRGAAAGSSVEGIPPVRLRTLLPACCVPTSKATSSMKSRLVLLAGLGADEIVVLRPLPNTSSRSALPSRKPRWQPPVRASRIARMLVSLFQLRFDPQRHDEQGAASQVRAIEKALEKVSNLSEDRVLRQLLALLDATLRTNFWRTGIGHSGAPGPRRQFLSVKLDSAKIPGLPQPVPLCEIFVYSPRFEGIHLRGARWPAAACAGPTGPTISAPRCWAWSRPRWSRTR
jgi:glutamate dehydrogenase